MNVHRFAILVVLAAALAVFSGAETPVCIDPADQRNAVVSGNVVAWEDSRHGNRDIYMKDLETGVETRVSLSAADETNPDIDGGRIVYQSGAATILLYELGTGATTTVAAAPGERSRPRISGNRVVWQDRRGSDWDVYHRDLETGVETLMTSTGDQHSPSVDGNQVIWVSEGADGGTSLAVYDYASLSTYRIAPAGRPSSPDLGGGAVTYLAGEPGNRRAYSHAITGGLPRAIEVGAGSHLGQRIDGARVVLEVEGTGPEIWVYSMNFETGTQITANGVDVADQDPEIDGTRIVWETDRNGNWDIYTASLDAGPITTAPVAEVTPVPTATPVQPGSRFGTRRYVVGAIPLNPPTGISGGAGRTVAEPKGTRAAIGTGTATGLTPPASRFVRWSPLTRWRAGIK